MLDLGQQLRALQAACSTMEHKLSITGNLGTVATELEEVKTQRNQLEKQNHELEARAADAEAKLSHIQAKMTDRDVEIRLTLEQKQSELTKSKDALAEAMAAKQVLEAKVSDLESSLESLRSEMVENSEGSESATKELELEDTKGSTGRGGKTYCRAHIKWRCIERRDQRTDRAIAPIAGCKLQAER